MEKKTPLYERHIMQGGKMVSYGGYLMPVQYQLGVMAEHMAVRTKAGLFDVSHMGEVILEGKDALENIQYLFTNDCSRMLDGQVRYSPMCNEEGGILDDVLIYRYHGEKFLIVVNAANTEKDAEWIKSHIFGDATFIDATEQIGQLALQGPKAQRILMKMIEESKMPQKNYTFLDSMDLEGIEVMISRTGYTGEDGFEIYCSSEDVPKLWDRLLEAGEEEGLIPCGLGARDTLRLEAGMPLYGHEMSEKLTPYDTSLGFAVKLGKEKFIGKDALSQGQDTKWMRVGIAILGRGIAREENLIYVGNQVIGKTTSGTHCPYLGKAVAMAIVDKTFGYLGQKVEVEVRGKRIEAELVSLPFYQRKKV